VTGFHKLLRVSIPLLLVLLPIQKISSQEGIKLRSTFGSTGSSGTFTADNHKYYIQQSIGQYGITGLAQKNGYILRQGFIQPLAGTSGVNALESLPAIIFPNPFSSNITISFSEELSDVLYVTLYDLSGRIVYFKKHSASREIDLDLNSFMPAVYFIRVNTTTRSYYSKVIKR